ncbi:hypothetical protein Tco_0002785, partial [Tanacetum coccineum]
RTSSNSRSHATVHDGQIITETVQRRAPGNVGNTGNRGTQNYGQMTDNVEKKMLLMEAKEKGTVLDDESEAFHADLVCIARYLMYCNVNGPLSKKSVKGPQKPT